MGMKPRTSTRSVTIYHNPKCSTSVHAMNAAEAAGVTVTTVLYLKPEQRPNRDELAKLQSMLTGPVEDMVRKDKRFKEMGLKAEDYVGKPDAVLDLLTEHIELMQRPILVRGTKAMIGRPKEEVAAFLA